MSTKALISTAVRLRLVLLSILGLLVVIATIIGFFGTQYLQGQATVIQQVVYDAANGDQKLLRVQELAAQLDNNQEAVARAQQIVAESKSYQYQDVIIKDLQAIAKRANITISNFDFTASSTQANKSGSKAAASSSGLRSTMVNISLDNPVNYRNLLTFLHYIEQNLTKMQVASVGLSGVTGSEGGGNDVTTNTLTIEVYIR